MKKQIFILILSLIFIIPLINSQTCPTGQVNDTYPGDCGIYTDSNSNQICDYSEPSASTKPILSSLSDAELKDLISGTEMKTKTVQQVAEIYQINSEELATKLSQELKVQVKPSDSIQLIHDNYGIGPEPIKLLIISIIRGQTPTTIEKEKSSTPYNITLITIISILLYLLSYFLAKKNKISQITHKRIWNFLLLLTFIITALTSLFYLFRVEYNLIFNLPFNISFWHIEIGYTMILISIFHVLWHIPYFKSYLRKKEKPINC